MELRSKSEFFKTYANGVNGVSFSGVAEYYIATLANDIDDDGKPNKPLFDKDKWETDGWKTDIQSTGYGTPGEGDVIYKYLWNVEVVSSKDANNVTTQTPTNVELYQTYVGGRIPSEYISYYSTNSSSGAPDKQPYVDTTNGNSIVVPTNTTWVVGSSFSGSTDENDYLFEISFVKYANKDENGLNQYAKMSGPTVIGRNGTNGISATNLVLDNDSDIISKNSLGAFLSSGNYLTKVKAEFFNGSSLVSDADIALTAPASLYTEQGTLNSDYAVYSSNELTITNLPATFTEGNFTFSCGGQEKIFKLLVVQSEVDYDLVLNKTVINTTNNGGTIVIKANRKDINGVTTLTGPDGNINLYSGDSNDPIANWSIVYNQGDETPLKLVLKTGNVIWDEETIEFVKNGEKGDQGTGVNIKANADSCIELGDAYIDEDGILRILTSTNPREFIEGGEIKGPQGIGISSVVNYYLLSDNTTGITISTEGWSTTLVSPSKEQGKKYLWNYEEIKYTEGKDPTYTTPAIIASYNEDGRGIVKIEEFYLISSDTTESKPSKTPVAPGEKPVANVWYNVPISTTEQYCFLWNCEKITYTTGNPEITDPVIIGTHGAKGDNAINYKLIITPKSWNSSAYDKTRVNFNVKEYDGANVTELKSGFEIKYGEETKTNLDTIEIENDTTFELYVNGKLYDTETVSKFTNGTSPYSVNLSNDSATIGAAANGDYDRDLLKKVSATSVSVFLGSKDITSECVFKWETEGGTIGLDKDSTADFCFGSLSEETATATVKISLNGGPIGTKTFTISKVRKGDQGPQGEQGTGVSVKANADSCIEIGDGYIDQTTGNLMVLTGYNERDEKQFVSGGQIKGPKGDAQFLHIAYATSSNGDGFSTNDPTDKTYIGTYVDGEEDDSPEPSRYTWKKWEGNAAVTYVLSITPNEFNISDSPDGIVPGFYVTKYIGDSAQEAGEDEYQIRKAGETNKWVPSSITEETTFDLYIKDANNEFSIKADSETIGAVKNGEDAKDFNITASSYAIIKDEQGNIKTDTSIVLTAHKINLGNESVSWRKNSTASNVIATGNTYTLDFAQDGAGTYYATCGDWSDSVTIIEVSDGTNGKSAISIVLSNPTMTFHKQASNESEACEVIVYEGGTKLELGSFAIVEKVASENVSISNANIIVSDPQESGSYSFTVSVTSSANETSTQDFTIYWKVVNDGNDAVSYSLSPAPLSWNKTTNSKQTVNFVAWKHEGGTQERLTDGYTITYNSKEVTNDSVEIEDTTTFTLNITDAPGVATVTVTAVSDGEEGPPTTMYTISSEVGEVPYNSAVTGTTVQFNINKIVGSNISPLDEEAKIYYSIGEEDKINITTSPIELPFKIENAQAEIVYHFYEKVGENYVKIETKRIQVLRAEQTYYLYHDQLQPDQTLIRPSGSYNSPSGQWYNEKKDGSKFQSWARISEDKLDEPANWSSVENIDGTIISKSNLFDILGEQDGIYNLDGSIAIKAGAIQTGALQVKDGNNVLFEADFGKDNTTGRVSIAGWNVDKDSISKGDALIYSGSDENYKYDSLITSGKSPIRFGAGKQEEREQQENFEFILDDEYWSGTEESDSNGEIFYVHKLSIDYAQLSQIPVRLEKISAEFLYPNTNPADNCYINKYEIDNENNKIVFSAVTPKSNGYIIKITLFYYFNENKSFAVLEDGSMYATGAKIAGDIEAKTLSTAPIYDYPEKIDIVWRRSAIVSFSNNQATHTFSLKYTPDLQAFWRAYQNKDGQVNISIYQSPDGYKISVNGDIGLSQENNQLFIQVPLKISNAGEEQTTISGKFGVGILLNLNASTVVSEQSSFSTDENGQVKFQVGQLGCWELDNFGLHGSTYDPNGNPYTISLTPNGISAKPNTTTGDSYNFSWFDLFNSLPTSTNLAMIAETSFEEEI